MAKTYIIISIGVRFGMFGKRLIYEEKEPLVLEISKPKRVLRFKGV